MVFERKGWSVGLGVAAAAATAVLVYFGNGLHPLWPLVWLAPLPVLLYALRSGPTSAWSAGVVAWAGWFAGSANFIGYFRVLGTPLVAWFTLFGLAALVFAAGVLLCRALVRRGAVWTAVVALPAVWVTYEYVRNLLWPHGSAGSLGYSQLNFLPFLQMASLTGPWGMSFVLLLLPSGVAVAWAAGRADSRRALRVAGATAGVVAMALVFGAARLAMRQPGPMVRVGLVTSDAPGNVWAAKAGADTERLLRAYAGEARGLIAQGAQVVVMPETVGRVVDPNTKAADAVLQAVADETQAMLVTGMIRIAGRLQYDEARVYTPGVPVRLYDKEHMLPPFEDIFTPGKALLMLHRPGALWGVAICKDMDFMNPARRNGRAGVGLMLVPGADFVVDGFWHGHIAVMRGVEDGFSVARAAKQGFLTVSDGRGRVVAERASDSAPFVTLLAEVPAGHEGTLYLLWGDWFAWFAMALCGWVLVQRRLGPASTRSTTESAECRERTAVKVLD
ncbi:MAG: nitrilase-related carbon-nitrogen hydrolase [Acidobacteriaceae bacterium]